MVRPENDDWSKVSFSGWKLHHESILSKIRNENIGPNNSYFASQFYAEASGTIDTVYSDLNKTYILIKTDDGNSKTVETKNTNMAIVKKGDTVNIGDPILEGEFTNNVFFINISRLLLVSLFITIGILVFIAYHKRKKEGTL